MNSSGENKNSKRVWVVILVGGLILESCLLAIVVGVFLVNRGLNLTASRNDPTALAQEIFPSVSPQMPTPLNSQATLTPPTTTLQSGATQPAPTVEGPTPSATFALPQFETPPDGKIVYTCFDGAYDQICIMNADGSERKQLTDDQATNFYPSLSPDGQWVVFSSRLDGNFEIYIMDVDGKNRQQLTDGIGNLYAPEISPNGNRIVFTGDQGGKQSIWVMKVDGGNARPLTEGSSDVDPSWSPDGEQIAFASARDGKTQLYIMTADGSNLHAVNPNMPKVGGRSSWSPEGDWLTFYAGDNGDHDIYLIGKDGNNLIQVTDGGDNLGPSFSPNGWWITFTSFRSGNNDIYIMHPDGSEVTRLTDTRNSDWQPRWGP
ncbi:MAG: DUF5050 domain-containing protein [Anaerolineales bacterium]|jgi:Tol biopolymer transport system component